MGARSGGGGSGRGGGGGHGQLSAAGERYLNLVQSGKFDNLSRAERERILEEVDKHAEKLGETLGMYEKAGVMDALVAYQGSGYRYMNDRAMGIKTGDKKFDAEIKTHMKNLDKAIEMRRTTHDMIVWRGSSRAEKNSRRYVSVSLHASVSDSFRDDGHIHAFRIPKGTPYAYSNRIGEYEMILPRGFKLQKYKVK